MKKICANCNFNHGNVCIVKNNDFKPVKVSANESCENYKELSKRLRDIR